MKIAFLSFSVAALLGLASFAAGFSFDVGVFVSGSFVAALLTWTIVQYRPKVRPLPASRPLRLPVRLARHEAQKPPQFNRLAA